MQLPGQLAGLACAVAVLLPVAAGLAGTLLASFGYLPGLDHALPGQARLSLAPWTALLAWPGLARSLALSVQVGAAATALSFGTALLLAALARRAAAMARISAALPPLLAAPHVAVAVGLAFLVAPSGWLVRLASPWLTGWRAPPDVTIVHDPQGLALIAGLWLKETPYLLLAMLAALAQTPARAALRSAASLGYGPWRAWLLAVLPLVWRQMRLPVMAVLAFSLSAVDVALVLGPGSPPPLAVQVVRWLDSPDLADWLTGSAGAVLLAALLAAALAALRGIEAMAALAAPVLRGRGARGGTGCCMDAAASAAGGLVLVTAAGALAVLAVWAGAAGWFFPAALPARWSAALAASRLAALGGTVWSTVWIAAGSALLGLLLSVAALAGGARPRAWLFAPLLVPQPAFLWGEQALLVRLHLDGGAFALIWAHLVFVLPYMLLSLADPWRALDARYGRAAASLGAPPWRVLVRVRLPLLSRPLLASLAVGVTVSVDLYLPTLFAGAGRIATLSTSAVALASGPDRAAAAAAALAQAALPLGAFALAVLLPSRHPRGRLAAAAFP